MAGQATGYKYAPEAASTAGIVADFYSDVKSKPTPAMLRALVDFGRENASSIVVMSFRQFLFAHVPVDSCV